jgi:hypothetical protein
MQGRSGRDGMLAPDVMRVGGTACLRRILRHGLDTQRVQTWARGSIVCDTLRSVFQSVSVTKYTERVGFCYVACSLSSIHRDEMGNILP